MNRREVLTGITVAAAFTPVGGWAETVTGAQSLIQEAEPSPEHKRKQYPICQQRGHAARTESGVYVNAMWRDPSEPEWSVCKFCGTSFRFVTHMEETNKP
jgi:hypothetical protein